MNVLCYIRKEVDGAAAPAPTMRSVPCLFGYCLKTTVMQDIEHTPHPPPYPIQVHAFGEVIRRVWSPSNFKSAVSPHEFIQAVSYASKKRFKPGVQSEAVDFLSWLLNSLHQVGRREWRGREGIRGRGGEREGGRRKGGSGGGGTEGWRDGGREGGKKERRGSQLPGILIVIKERASSLAKTLNFATHRRATSCNT